MSDSPAHKPKHQYDCKNCKYSWCCGPACHCHLMYSMPEPPRARQDEVDRTLVQLGYAPQFHGRGAQRR